MTKNNLYKLNLQTFAGNPDVSEETEVVAQNQGIENSGTNDDKKELDINSILEKMKKIEDDNKKMSQTITRLVEKKTEVKDLPKQETIPNVNSNNNNLELEEIKKQLALIKEEKFNNSIQNKILNIVKNNQIEDKDFIDDILNESKKINKDLLSKLTDDDLNDYLEGKLLKDIVKYKNIKDELAKNKINSFRYSQIKSTPINEYISKFEENKKTEDPYKKAFEQSQKIQKSIQDKELKKRFTNELDFDDIIIK